MKSSLLFAALGVALLSVDLFPGRLLAQSSQTFECGLADGSGGITPITGTVRPVIVYCVNINENDVLPSYLNTIPGKIDDFYNKASGGLFRVIVAKTIKRDTTHAIMGRIDYGGLGPFIASNAFIRDIFSQADTTYNYNFGLFDNDGPDGVPNSGDDDGYVDFVIFWMLNYSGRGVAGLYDMVGDFTTKDTSWGAGHTFRGYIKISPSIPHAIECRKDLRDNLELEADYLGADFHELGHTLLNFPDMDHVSFTWYDHFSIGSFDPMANGYDHKGVSGFNGVASLYNPWFREQRGWTTTRPLSGDSLNIVLPAFDATRIAYKYHPTSLPSEATPVNDFMITYHVKDPTNVWTTQWPIDTTGGVLIWHLNKASVELYDASYYSDKRKMPIDIEAAHGKFIWSDTLNSGVQNSLTGLDSIEYRKLTNNQVSWYPYHLSSSNGVGSQTVFYVPNSGKEYAFYTNPNSSYYRNNASESYAHSVTSGLSLKNLTRSAGITRVDLRTSDYGVSQNATMSPGTWYIKGNMDIQPNVVLTIDGPSTLNFASNLTVIVRGSLVIKNNAIVAFVGHPTFQIEPTGSITVQAGGTLRIDAGSLAKFAAGTSLVVNGRLVASGSSSQRIVFTSSSATPAPGDWSGIVCSGGGPDTLTYCDIKYAETGLWFQNTAANSYLQNDTIRYSSSGGSGLIVSNTGTANRSLRMYKCGINTNDGIGLMVGNAKVSISYSRIENNGLQWISEGVYVYSGARVFFDSSRIQNNNGSGIKISGTGSRALLTPDSSKTGYNTVYQHGVSELWLTSSGAAFLGGGYGPGNYGGYNNVYNTYNYSCRLINNATSNLVSAKWTYWGSSGNRFCGPVDSSLWLGSPVNTPSVMQYHDPGSEPMAVVGPSATLSDWLIQLKSDITNNSENAFDALHHLANFSGPGGGYQSVLGMSWENFLSTVIDKSTLPSVRSLATALLVQSSLDKGDFAHGVTSADDLLAKKLDNDLRFFLQTRKIYADVGLGNISSAQDVLSEIQATASLSDTDAVKAMTEYVSLASKSAQDNGSPGYFVKNSTVQDQTPNRYLLSQNFPNPFNPTTSFKYQIAIAGHVSLKIYDVLGREVALIVDEQRDPGEYNVTWDASTYSSGVYFFKLQAGTFTDVKKMLLVR